MRASALSSSTYAARTIQGLALVLATSAVSCLPSASLPSESANGLDALAVTQTASLSPSGFPLNGTRVEGVTLAFVSVRGATLRGVDLDRVAPEGPSLVAHASGRPLRDRALLSTVLRGETVQGEPAWLRIYEITRAGDASGVQFYKVAHLGPQGWRPLCDGSNEAAALAGLWDYRAGAPGGGDHTASRERFTFACRGSALAQCMELGYLPWRAPARCAPGASCPESLAAHHQACVRLHRADYCGDGRSFTTPGVFVNLYDSLGLQQDTEQWTPEAEWNERGAVCIRTPRLSGGHARLPECARGRLTPSEDCTRAAPFRAGTLLINEVDPRSHEVLR